MKRTLSLVLVVSMLLSMVAIAPFYSSAIEDRVETEAYYYGGTVQFAELSGTGKGNKLFTWEDPYSIKDGGDASVGELLINGIIDEGEWGNPSFVVDSAYAATNAGITTGQNGACEEPSAENTYFYYNDSNYIYNTPSATSPVTSGMSYKVYLMWDENYLYVAADVDDTSGHKNTETGTNIWNGDIFQFRVDKDGSYTLADGYEPYGTFDEDNNRIANYPWRTSVYKSGVEFTSEVPNFIVGYSTSGNGTTVTRDNANRYYPHDVEVDDTSTEVANDTYIETQYLDVDVSALSYAEDVVTDYATYVKNGGCAPEVKEWGPVYAVAYTQKVVDPATGKESNTHSTTQYEIAVPWEYIDDADNFLAEAGLELGLSTMVIDRQNTAASSYGAFLEWGNGINNHRTFHDYQTCNGSNSLVLSAEAYNTRDYHEHVFAEATCIEPETCIVAGCGYQRGYKAGHEYAITEYKLPSDSEAGYAKAVCTVCGDAPERVLAASSETVYKSLYSTDGYVNLQEKLSSAFSVAWTHHTWSQNPDEDGELVWESTAGATVLTDYGDNKNVSKTMLWLDDQVRPQIDDDIAEMVNPYDFTVLDMTGFVQTGTYYEMYSFKSKNYAVNMKVDLWDLLTQAQKEKEGETGYHDSLLFWFGENLIEYCAGLFIVEETDENDVVTDSQAFFAVGPAGLNAQDNTIEDFKEMAFAYKEIDLEELSLGIDAAKEDWKQMTFFADFDANVALLFWDGEYVTGAYDYHFARPEGTNESDPIIRLFNITMCVTDLEAGNSSIASNYVTVSGNIEVPDVGGDDTTVPPVTDPIVTDPPVTDPIVTDPPVTDPIVTDPPVTDPIVDENPLGSYVNPYLLNLGETNLAVTVEPGMDAYVKVSDSNNTVVSADATNANYMINYVRQTYVPETEDNATSFTLVDGFDIFCITNTSETDTVVLNLALAEGGEVEVPNSVDNPEVLELQDFMGRLSAYAEYELSAGNQGRWYKIVAPADGTLMVGASAYNSADYSEVGWMYFVNNITANWYGEYHFSTDEEPVYFEELEVKAGDEIILFVSTNDPADMWNNPAGTVSVNAIFVEPSPIGSWDNPEIIDEGAHTAEIEVDAFDGYYSEWTADKNGEVTITMKDAEGWMYYVEIEKANGEYIYGDYHMFNDDPAVPSATFEVEAGDVVTVMVNAYDPENMWNNPGGTINWTLSFKEVINMDGFTLLVTGEEIDGQYHVYYEILNNPGIWSIAANLKFNADRLELVEVKNGSIFAGEDEYVEVPAVDGTHRYFANGEDADFGDKTENGILVEYVFDIKKASNNYGIEVTVNAEDVFNSDLVDQPLTVVNTLEVKTVMLTVDGVAGEYTIGDTFEITADQITVVDGIAYVFDGWVVEGAEVADASALTLTFTIPENDVTITRATYVHGNVDGDADGKVAGFDAAALANLIKNDTYSKYGDLNFDGKVTGTDSIILMQIIKGEYEY